MPNCPTCGDAGRKVQRVTLDSLLRPIHRTNMTDEQHYVCSTPDCDTVYFCSGDGRTFLKSDLAIRFGLKETESPRPVCYCFDHTMEEIEAEIRRTGESTVIEHIKSDMDKKGCRCEHTNPLGGCCLKSIQTIITNTLKQPGKEMKSPMLPDCCQRDEAAAGSSTNDRSGALAVGGSLVAAILSSACCWLPLLLFAFGASVVGVAAFFEAYRPYLIAVATGLLAFGFYSVYFRMATCEPGSACAKPNRRLRFVKQAMLWTATVLVSAFVFFPNYVGYIFGSSPPPSASGDDAGLAVAAFHIEGMTCEGCAVNLKNALSKLPGAIIANVDYLTRTAVVRYDPTKPVPPEEIIEAVKAAGYQVQLNGASP